MADARAQEGRRPLQPADLFRLERIGKASFSPDGRFLVYERARAAGIGPVRRLTNHDQVRKDLWLADLDNDRQVPCNLTHGEESGAGYWHPVWSRTGLRLAFLRIHEGRLRGQIWECSTGAISRLSERGLVSHFSSEPPLVWESDLAWLSDSLIACLAWPEGSDEPGRIRSETRPGENSARLGPIGWSGAGVTAEVFEAGSDSVRPAERRHSDLLLIDLENGTERIRGGGAYSTLRPSADGKYLACFDQECPIARPQPGSLPKGMLSWERPALRIFETCSAEPAWETALPGIPEPTSMRWSLTSNRLALRCRPSTAPDGWPSQLIRVLPETQKVDNLKREGMEIQNFVWCGEELLVLAKSTPATVGEARLDLWRIVDGGEWLNLTGSLEAAPGRLWQVPDGSAVVGLASGRLWNISSAHSEPRDVTPPQLSRIDAVLSPESGRGGLVAALIVDGLFDDGAGAELPAFVKIDLVSGGAQRLYRPAKDASVIAVSPDGGRLVYLRDDLDGLNLWLLDVRGETGEERLLVKANGWLSEIEVGEWRPVDYRSLDGEDLRGWLLTPPGYEDGQKIPLVTFVYPGLKPDTTPGKIRRAPMSHFLDLQLFVAPGYALLVPQMPMPPEGEVCDPYLSLQSGVMPAVEKAIQMEIADPNRIALAGHSFGGYGVYGLVTQTNRFRCAVAMAGFTNLLSAYGTMDARMRYGDFNDPQSSVYNQFAYLESGQGRMGGPPWEDQGRYLRNSPITYVGRVTTPLLMIHGDGDPVPLPQAEEFFTALYRQNKRACLVRYAGEGHLIEGEANVLDVWRRVYEWFSEFFRSPGVT